MKSIVFRASAWLQLAFSMALAASVIWAYSTYGTALDQSLHSAAETIVSATKVIALTAESVQANDALLDDTQALMKSTRRLVEELRSTAQNNASLAPRYAEGMQGIAGLLGRAGNSFSTIGDGLMTFSLPTVERDGIRPSFGKTHPLESQGAAMKQTAADLNASAASLQILATSIAKDGPNMAKATVDTSNQAIKLLDSSEMALKRLRSQALPGAVAEMRAASAQLSSVSSGINIATNLPLGMLVVGLLLAGWCLFNSLSVLHLYSIQGRK